RTTCSRIVRPVDWSSTTITVLRAAGSTRTCAFFISFPLPVSSASVPAAPEAVQQGGGAVTEDTLAGEEAADELGARNGLADVVSLHAIAAQMRERRLDFGVLDAFGDDGELEVVRQL